MWIILGYLSIKTGKYQQTADSYDKAMVPCERYTRTWTSWGDARKKTGIYDENVAAYDHT